MPKRSSADSSQATASTTPPKRNKSNELSAEPPTVVAQQSPPHSVTLYATFVNSLLINGIIGDDSTELASRSLVFADQYIPNFATTLQQIIALTPTYIPTIKRATLQQTYYNIINIVTLANLQDLTTVDRILTVCQRPVYPNQAIVLNIPAENKLTYINAITQYLKHCTLLQRLAIINDSDPRSATDEHALLRLAHFLSAITNALLQSLATHSSSSFSPQQLVRFVDFHRTQPSIPATPVQSRLNLLLSSTPATTYSATPNVTAASTPATSATPPIMTTP